MRTIGFLIAVLFVWPVPTGTGIPGGQNRYSYNKFTASSFPSLFTASAVPNKKRSNDIDTTSLKQSDWYADVLNGIATSEYEIKPAGKDFFASPNREQNLRASYSSDQFILEPRENDSWKLALQVKGVFAGKNKIYSPLTNAVASIDNNAVSFDHDAFITEYINNKEGVRQNFIIKQEPASHPKQLSVKLQTNKGWFINQVHPKEIHFAKKNGELIEKKLTYNDLKVWDANNELLNAYFSVNKNEISINVNTANAVYPVTIDPITTTANWSTESNQAGTYYGWSVASAGDVNADGYSDIIVGAPYYDNGQSDEGKVFVYHGSATGLSLSANWTMESDQAGALMGLNANTAGDVNGDGYSDVIIGALYYDAGQTDEGKAFVYYGSLTGLAATAAWTTESDQASAEYGGSVACAGDVNGDGYSDVIVGSPNYDNGNTDEGKAFVYYGSAAGLAVSPAWTAEGNQDDANFGGTQNFAVGTGVASAGDVNGDGYSDVIVGASRYDNGNTDEGKVFVYHGSASGLSVTANWTAESDQDYALMGNSMASAGDVNGDGYSDVIVGAYGYDNGQNGEGKAYVYYGSSTGLSVTANWTYESNVTNALLGCSVASAGDVNGDGYSDVIVGASYYTNGQPTEGAAFAFFGSATGLSASYNWMVEGNLDNATLGGTLSPAGDVNGDGYSDIVVGAFDYTNGQAVEGAAFVYHGSPDGLNSSAASWTVESNQAGAEMGFHISGVASAGDVNGDGYSDVIIGVPLYDNGQTDEGMVWVYYGSSTGLPLTPSWTAESDQATAYFGVCVSFAGDVNGDGYGDVIIGANYYDAGQTDEGKVFVYHGSAGGLSATANWTAEGNQAGANMGQSVAAAGDVNGDGYGDVIVGAMNYDNTFTDEGEALLYYGSGTGLAASPAWTVYGGQVSDFFSHSVAGAGDVNGDGYCDVIVGAHFYDSGQTDEGKAFLYYGSASGLSTTANWTGECNVASAGYAVRVASAGDVNGDGYGDVIIGAHTYSNGQSQEGAAYVYHGSSTGLSASPNWTIESNIAGAYFGIVSSAGDINGDGYSDVLVGAIFYTNGESSEGKAFVYNGSSTGLSTSSSWSYESNQAGASFSYGLACAGDVNGDGFSDILIAAPWYDNGQTDEGKVFLYYGNLNGGLRNNLRLYNSDLITPIQQSNMSDPNLFGAGLYGKSFIGKQKGKMVWQTVKNGVAFPGTPITNNTAFTGQQSSFTDLGLTGIELKNQVAKQNPAKATYIRARVKYDMTTAITGQVYGPWRYPEGFMRGRRDVGAVALPVKFISFSAIKTGSSAKLKWVTTDEETGVQFAIQHSVDGIHFNTLAFVNGNDQQHNEYEWIHTNPVNGNNFYHIKAIENDKTVLTDTRLLNFSNIPVTSLYPNPAVTGQDLFIKNEAIKKDGLSQVSFFNSSGQLVWQKQMIATANGMIFLNVPAIPGGPYIVQIETGQHIIGNVKIIVEKR